ncbi:c-type cytochrome [Methylomonas paludis]|uniref:C-type cytochrome n=1 Tax=Methylomonas paludis TaxID=1173101 RepID=A0A975MPP8_9GAMM|nr:c-type cytochrome [Methylomonas paludis]QWF71707.1 c-type cytochrome [Methylomonas paludis]
MRALAWILAGAGLLTAGASQAASPYAGQEKAAAVCSQCHGIRTPSADAPFPPLAGRDPEYLKSALKQYRNKTRVSDLMNAVAGSLSDEDINNIVSYYANVRP